MDLKYLGFLIQGAVLGVSAATMPGMFQTMLISETLIGGYKRSFPIAFVPLLSDFPIILLTLIVLKQLPPVFTRLMSMAGGGYVIYLAWGLIRQWKSGVISEYGECDNSVRPWVLMRRVVLMNFLNPNPYLFCGTSRRSYFTHCIKTVCSLCCFFYIRNVQCVYKYSYHSYCYFFILHEDWDPAL